MDRIGTGDCGGEDLVFLSWSHQRQRHCNIINTVRALLLIYFNVMVGNAC